jgi:tRNA (adenine37-N6)-methyltransferase
MNHVISRKRINGYLMPLISNHIPKQQNLHTQPIHRRKKHLIAINIKPGYRRNATGIKTRRIRHAIPVSTGEIMNTNSMNIHPIGTAQCSNGSYSIRLEKEFIPALSGIEEFSHLMLIWWADGFDRPEKRNILVTEKPYRKGPDKLGIFATRSPLRPNPLCVSICPIKAVDSIKGTIDLYYADTKDNTLIVDIKPYQPSADRVRNVRTPEWCSDWPQHFEDSANFDWEQVFNF